MIKSISLITGLVFALLLFTGCQEKAVNKALSNQDKVLPNKESNQTNNESKTVKVAIKPEIDFSSLIGRTPAEIEKICGKPTLIDSKLTNSGSGEYRIYEKNKKRLLQVDYFKGLAVALYFEIPEEKQSKTPESTLEICGLRLSMKDANSETKGFWWESVAPFKTVRIARYNDSGLYYSCEVHSV